VRLEELIGVIGIDTKHDQALEQRQR